MIRLRLLATSLLALSAIPSLAVAQQSGSGANASGSGSAITTGDSTVVIEDREFRLRGFSQSLATAALTDAAFREKRALYYTKRADYRAACRDDIRKSNKTTLLKTLLRCYKSELSWFKDFLEQQTKQLTLMAGVSASVRAQAVSRAELLTDAVGTVIFAIDSGVYSEKEAILEVKRNLYKKYEAPLFDAWTTVRADAALTWAARLIADIDVVRSQELAAGLDRPDLPAARSCLVEQENALRQLLKGTAAARGEQLAPVLRALQDCTQKIRTTDRAVTASGSLLAP